MQSEADRPEAPNTIHNNLGVIFVSLELSRSTWLITSLSSGGGEKMSKHNVPAGPRAVDAIFGSSAEDGRADWKIIPDHRHSGSRVGRLLDSSRVAEGRD
jgi:transposase